MTKVEIDKSEKLFSLVGSVPITEADPNPRSLQSVSSRELKRTVQSFGRLLVVGGYDCDW
jgi:hypothetical protein